MMLPNYCQGEITQVIINKGDNTSNNKNIDRESLTWLLPK